MAVPDERAIRMHSKWLGGMMIGASVLVALGVAGCGLLPRPLPTPATPAPTPAPAPAPKCGDSTCDCPDVGNDTFEMYLPFHKHNKTVSLPPLPTELSDYSYATDEARVVIPKECADKFRDNITDVADFEDRQPGGRKGLLYFRVSKAEGKYALLQKMLDGADKCACGLVINLHGSSGNWNVVTHSAMLAAMGYVVVMPDSQAMPDKLGLKGNGGLKPIKDIIMSNWCGKFDGYNGSCSNFDKPYCYSSKFENIVNDQAKYRKYMQRVYWIRKLELDWFVEQQADFLAKAGKLFLMGGSEGGMIASRYYNTGLFKHLSGTIIISFSCEFNYFVPCPDAARVCGHQCETSLPQLNLIGDADEYFGPVDTSLAQRVAHSPSGYGAATITGNCASAYKAKGFTHATVVVFKDTQHSPFYWNDNVLRNVMADFVANPTSGNAGWKSFQDTDICKKDDATGVFTCLPLGPLTCQGSKAVFNENATWNFTGEYEKCSATSGHQVWV